MQTKTTKNLAPNPKYVSDFQFVIPSFETPFKKYGVFFSFIPKIWFQRHHIIQKNKNKPIELLSNPYLYKIYI